MALQIRQLRQEDIPSAMALKSFPGWNQTEDDWRLFLELIPGGCFALERGGTVLATSTAVPYGDAFGWIGMMLVHPDERRKGHGTRLLEKAVEFLERRGLVPGLDATPMGKPLYERHGFQFLCGIERRIGMAPLDRKPHPACSRLDAASLDAVLDLDGESFGADRSALLRGLLRREGSLGFLYRQDGRAEGYLMGRPGTRFFHLGPWVARDPGVAGGLLDAALSTIPGIPVGVDVLVPNARARILAEGAGLTAARTPVRMVKGSLDSHSPGHPPPGGRPDRIYGLAGLEWG